MCNNIFLSGLLSWSSPLTYLFLTIVSIVFISIRVVVNANQFLKEHGGQLSFNLFSNRYNRFFKWTAMHQTQTGIVIMVVLVVGIMWAIKFGS